MTEDDKLLRMFEMVHEVSDCDHWSVEVIRDGDEEPIVAVMKGGCCMLECYKDRTFI